MINKIFSILCMVLIVSSSFASAQSNIPIFSNTIEDTGESIIVNVDKIEPTIVPTNVLEEQNVPVYVYLKGATLGSLAFADNSPSSSPLFGIPQIERVAISGRKSTNNIVSNVQYIKPRDKRYVVDNNGRFFDMGYLIVELRKTNENELPEFNDTLASISSGGASLSAGGGATINAEITLDIRFDLENTLSGFGSKDLRLIERTDEENWINENGKASFWSNSGYIRADKISDEGVTLSVYDGRLRRIRTFTLNRGEISSPIRLQDFGPVQNSFFRVRLNDIILPKDTATFEINGDVYNLVEGQRLYPGSNWKVERIKNSIKEDTQYDEVIIVNNQGQRKSLKIVYLSKKTEPVVSSFSASINKVDVNSAGYKKYANKFESGFVNKVEVISNDLGINPNHLMAVMAFESGFNPRAENSDSNALGLIQFLPSTADSLGTSTNSLRTMSSINQLDLVKNYLNSYKDKIRLGNLEDVYMAVLYPNGIGRDSNFVIFNSGTIAYNQNSRLDANKDGRITITEATNKVRATYSLELKEESSPTAVAEDEDVCQNVEFEDADALTQTSIRLYCKSIAEIKESISRGLEENELNSAYYYLGQAYEGLSENNLFYKRQALSAYSLVSGGELFTKANEEKEEINRQISENLDLSNAEVFLEDENIKVKFTRLDGVSAQEEPTVTLSINNEQKTLKVTDVVINGVDDKNRNFNWIVDSIASNRIILRQIFSEDSTIKGRTETVNLDEVKTLQTNGDKSVVLQIISLDTKKQAYVTVLPGTGVGKSISVVDVNIPIERRSIQFNTEQIDSQINATRAVIKKLDRIIDGLDKTVKTWKAICIGVFAFISLKNLLTVSSEVSEARDLVMRGADGKSGFGQYCSKNSGVGKDYSNYDECVIKNKDYINARINEEAGNIKSANEFLETGYAAEYSQYKLSSRADILIPQSDARDLNLLQLQVRSSEDKLKTLNHESVEYAIESQNLNSLDEQLKAKQASLEKTKSDITAARDYSNTATSKSGLSGSERDNFAKEVFDTRLNQLSQAVQSQTVIEEFGDIQPVFYVDGKALDPNGNIVIIEEVKGSEYLVTLNERIKNDPKNRRLLDLKTKLERSLNNVVITESGSTLYRDKAGKYYYSETENYFGERIRQSYVRPGVVEFYQNGRPFCVPTSNGNYVRVLEYYGDGTPKTVDERNVGPNGVMCDNDDVIITSDSLVKLNLRKEQELKQAVARAGLCKPGTTRVGNLICSFSSSANQEISSKIHCTDVMSAGDCQIIFNVCDPVMCPTSRFNLGGRWNVDSVPETGIIGSLVLGYPNFVGAGGTDLVPVCLPGVQSGLEGIRSLFQGYEQCLQTSKATGQNVGICDKIKSVFICETLWRESTSVISSFGGIVSSIGDRLLSNTEGGGEYSPGEFSKRLEQTGDSAKFFVDDYSTSALASYKSRSLGQVGTEVCRNVYAGTVPGVGNFIDQITTPDSPPQFTAFFDEYPWASSAGDTRLNRAEGIFSNVEEQSRYNVFYHIYAGRATDIRYSVYLKDNLGNVAYVTDRAGGSARGFVPKGEFVSKNLDFIGRSGYAEICVEINGKLNCGFGRATTEFGAQYITDKTVVNELNKEIKTKEECVPEDETGPAIGGPTSFGDVTGGLIRVCSISNPGTGGVEGNWQAVGKCGEDEEGLELGQCWIDTRTIRLNNKEIVDENIKNIVQKETGDDLGLGLTREEFENKFNVIYNALIEKDMFNILLNEEGIFGDEIKKEFIKFISNEDDESSLRFIAAKSIDFGALAQLRIGQIYLALAKDESFNELIRSKVGEVSTTETSQITGEATATFTLCVSDDVYYCVNDEEMGYYEEIGYFPCYGGSVSKRELTQEQCRIERGSKLVDSNACSDINAGTIFSPSSHNKDVCHQRTKDMGSCLYNSKTSPNLLTLNECFSCNTVQREKCSAYKDEVECEKWDPCVFDCAWSEDKCVSVKAYREAQILNEATNSAPAPDVPTVPDGQDFILKYSDKFFSSARLYIEYPGLDKYYINNGKLLDIKNMGIIDADYPILKGSNSFDYYVGYVDQDGKFNIAQGEKNEALLERMDVDPKLISLLFSEEKDGTYQLDNENKFVNKVSGNEATGGQTTLTVPTRSVILSKEQGEVILSTFVPDKDGILVYDPASAVADALYYKYDNGWLWSSEKTNWNLVQSAEGENNAQQALPQSHREFIGYLENYNPTIDAVKDAVLVATVNKFDGPAPDSTYSYTPVSESSVDTTYYKEDISKTWEWSFDKVNWNPVASTSDTADGNMLTQEQIDIINSLNFAQLSENSNQLQPIFSIGLNGKTIVIDSGHGGTDGGTTHNENGRVIKESDLVLDISKKLKGEFEKNGATVFMTRNDDSYISLYRRKQIANSYNPDLFLSVHINNLQTECVDGTEAYVFCAEDEDSLQDGVTNFVSLNQCKIKNEYYDESLRAAQEIQPLIVNYIGTKNRGISGADFSVLQDSLGVSVEAPAILVELGYLCSPGDRVKLLDVGTQEKIALSIVDGANQFFA